MGAPVFAGATTALAQTAGPTPLFGYEWIETLKLPVAAAATQVLLGDFSSITAVAFNSASIELIANPYEAAAFSKGSTLLRAIASIGVGQSDAARICKTTVNV
jgi:HK97 family phage major capsid protein